ncbi:MAG TPA: right-handed parallel beta-helix repeat-containing protein [Beutenbergiaceae bacterium]|nr:right-handed parallel beta-helix repeat-containing protein [Beutenbergiaceae bacterium]
MSLKSRIAISFGSALALCLSMLPAQAAPAPEPHPSPAEAEVTDADSERVLFEDDFTAGDGAQWEVSTANAAAEVSFEGGMATIRGGGPENRMLSKEEILASSFTFSFDLFINEGNTNSAVKFGFFADESASSRYQVTYDGPNDQLRLEQVVAGSVTRLGDPATLDLPVNTGAEPHEVSIEVDGDRVRASVNGEGVLEVDEAGTASAPQGRILFASQFPNQDFSVDNVRVVTSEEEAVGKYTVEVATETNGVRDTSESEAGGTLTANRSSGDPGDVVRLTPTARPGYVFDGYESLRADTETSTDGLLTITDHQFELDDITGSVIIIAKFITEPEDPNVVFKDYFSGDLNDHGQYDLHGGDDVYIDEGQLHLDPSEGPVHALVENAELGALEDYSITFDARKVNATPGTTQIAFRADGFDNRYVLALNGSKALLRRLDGAGANVELASALYQFDQTPREFRIDVSGETVSVTANNSPVLSYTNEDDGERDRADWSGTSPAFGLINMTAGAPVAFDNVVVARTPVTVNVDVVTTIDGEADEDRLGGAVELSQATIAAGESLSWQVYPKGGYELAGVSLDGEELDGNELVIDPDAEGDLTLVADFSPVQREATTYYIDSASGDDERSGTSPEDAWATLASLDRRFYPGDEILLKNGSVFDGAEARFAFEGSGTAGAPIVVGTYGEGDRPRLNGAGEVENVLTLHNQEYVTVSGLEITNLDPGFGTSFGLNENTNRNKNLRAVNVSARDFGVVHGITVRDLYVHSVNGNLDAKWNGGIFFDVKANIDDGELHGVPTKFHDVLIEGNTIERVDRSGIKLVSSAWSNQSLVNDPQTPLNWYPSTGVVVRDNQLRYLGGDAITVRDTDGALVEHNLARHARYQNTGYNAGIWPFQTTNTVIQYNEVSNTHGVQDGQGLDTDHVSSYSVMQYNYSHNNEGGFMLIMNGFPHTAPTVRYNISQNDADKTFEFARGTPAGTMIYNNTIYSETTLQGPRGGVLDLANSGAGTGNREVFIFNNIFHYPEGQTFYVGEAETMKTKAKLFNNAYAGGITPPVEEEQPILGDLLLPDVGSAPADNEGSEPLTGANVGEHFAGYVPQEESPLHEAGVSIEELVAHYDGTVTDRRDMSPTKIHDLALQGESIDFVAGRNLPAIPGVEYGTDFLGNPLPAEGEDEAITIGAIQRESADEETPGPEDPEPGEPEEPEVPETPEPGEPEAPETPEGPGSGGEQPGDDDADAGPGAEDDSMPQTGLGGTLGLVLLAAGLILAAFGVRALRRRTA